MKILVDVQVGEVVLGEVVPEVGLEGDLEVVEGQVGLEGVLLEVGGLEGVLLVVVGLQEGDLQEVEVLEGVLRVVGDL